MKKLAMLLVAFFCFYTNINGQTLTKIIKTRSAFTNSGDYLHKIANEFSAEVGNKLKELYPTKVANISVALKWNDNTGFTLEYSADIVKASMDDYHYYFDHRGSFSVSKQYQAAFNDAKERCQKQLDDSVPKFAETYDSIVMFSGYTANAKSSNGQFAVVCEGFIAAR